MCGLAAFIGKSKDYFLSYKLFNTLFVCLEERGVDASGFYGTKNDSEEYFFYKQSGKASELIKANNWKEIENFELDLLMIHTRKISSNSGNASDNNNNHPFLGIKNKSALVHNGIVHEYEKLKKCYETLSKCDSEILLRVLDFQFDSNDYVKSRLNQIKGLLGLIKASEFTFLLSDLFEDKKSLWAIKNEHRPLFMIDAREELNQIIFVSTVDIWQNALDEMKNTNLKKCKVFFLENNFIINVIKNKDNSLDLKFFSYNWENYSEFNLIN
jgi:glucosamine 6-phosphate synthetase-like amidotransferase/phosphosugar isomerase protein